MGPLQFWLVNTFSQATTVARFMRSDWGWPATESVHFIGLTLLFGSILMWDLRLLGMARSVPLTAFHRLIPFAVIGFAINAASGSLFLMTEPDQYIYNPAFHFKLLFIALAGLNVLIFYVTTFGRATRLGPGVAPPLLARVSGAASLAFWTAVIICGRLITFYRPVECEGADAARFLVECIIIK